MRDRSEKERNGRRRKYSVVNAFVYGCVIRIVYLRLATSLAGAACAGRTNRLVEAAAAAVVVLLAGILLSPTPDAAARARAIDEIPVIGLTAECIARKKR